MVCCSLTTLALYCPRCGSIEIHEFNRFLMRQTGRRELKCSCGHVQATVVSASRNQYLLDIPCLLCETNHIVAIDSRQFWRAKADKIYCPQENLEIGMVGERQLIEHTIAKDKLEFDNLVAEDSDFEFIENPPVMFQILNKVHDVAEKGAVHCHCGSTVIETDILPDGVLLKCVLCGSYQVIRAQTHADLEKVKCLDTIELTAQGRRRKRSGSRMSSEEVSP